MIAVLRRTSGYTLTVDGDTTHLSNDQALDLHTALREALSPARPPAVTPAKATFAKA